MLAALTLISLAAIQFGPIDTAYALGGVMKPGRHPVPSDPVIEAMVRGKWQPPTDWTPLKANSEGWFENRALRSAYVYMPVESPEDRTVLLDAAGHTMVYVNGVPRAGDPYGYGYLTLPIKLRKGRNDLVFVSGRGRVRAAIKPVEKPIEFDTRDLTTPDVLPTDRQTMRGAVVIRNSRPEDLQGAVIEAETALGTVVKTSVPIVMGESIRKVPFSFATPRALPKEKLPTKLRIRKGNQILNEAAIELRVRDPKQTYKRTFVSSIDDSVQYYVVNPAQKPAKTNHLVLSVHGASVEATSQADAYKSKDDITIVAATNRRPYGFDWEDWGRIDALEVLQEAKRTIPHDPLSVHITGHSMGGHGTWYIGTLYPDLFASVSPAAGWISFWSYGGGWNPENPTSAEKILRRSMNASNVLARLSNTQAQGLFVLHGDADESVPVSEARRMKEELTKLGHGDFGYHEVPGGSHWWSNESVDWPGIFEVVRRRRLDTDPERIDFTTPNPAVSSKAWWAEILQQTTPLEPSVIRIERKRTQGALLEIAGSTENICALRLALPKPALQVKLTLDGQQVSWDESIASGRDVIVVRQSGRWTSKPSAEKAHRDQLSSVGSQRTPSTLDLQPVRLVKDAYNNRMAFVYGTKGSPQENEWARNKARFDAESWYYRGNGSVDVLPDTTRMNLSRRNVILYGNESTNRRWAKEVSRKPIRFPSGKVVAGGREVRGNVGYLAVLPGAPEWIQQPGLLGLTKDPSLTQRLVGVVGGATLEGMRRTDRLPVIAAGTAFPSWILVDDTGIVGDGFFRHDWQIDPYQTAWRD